VTFVLKLCGWSTQDIKKEPPSERELWELKILHINNLKLVQVSEKDCTIFIFYRCPVCGEWCTLHWLLLDTPSFHWNTRRSRGHKIFKMAPTKQTNFWKRYKDCTLFYFFSRCPVCVEWCKLHWLLLDTPSFDWNTRRSRAHKIFKMAPTKQIFEKGTIFFGHPVYALDTNGLHKTGVVILKQWTIKNTGIRKSDRIPKPILPDNQLMLSGPLRTWGTRNNFSLYFLQGSKGFMREFLSSLSVINNGNVLLARSVRVLRRGFMICESTLSVHTNHHSWP
jgi:hypothetical protein